MTLPKFTTKNNPVLFDPSQKDLLKKRYLHEGEKTFDDLVNRVAGHGAPYNEALRESFKYAIGNLWFVPSRMVYMGTEYPFASSCFVLPIEDDFDSIVQTMWDAGRVQRWGGGTGYNWSALRPKGDLISKTGGDASGPVSFMKLYHHMMETINRAGKKHAAQMGILNADHPEIMNFINAKKTEGSLWTFNISVGATDEFMRAVENDMPWDLVYEDVVYETVSARQIWQAIAQGAWANGEPGLAFLDAVDEGNCFPEFVNASNPCGEQFLPPYTSCNLGSLNLGKFIVDGDMDWNHLEFITRIGIQFLDSSLDQAWWPLDKVREKSLSYRNVGLGVMGLADAFALMGIPYNSWDAIHEAERIMSFIQSVADDESNKLAERLGSPLGDKARRNVTVTSIAPTGSISFLADASSSAEPYFGVAMTRNTYIGSYQSVAWPFKLYAQHYDFDHESVYRQIEAEGTVQNVAEIPDEVKVLFPTAMEVDWIWHVRMQGALQKYVDNSVSKTINLANSATIHDVEEALLEAWKLGCKSITVYRDGSREVQVLDSKKVDRELCPECKDKGLEVILFRSEGCAQCAQCGYSACDI